MCGCIGFASALIRDVRDKQSAEIRFVHVVTLRVCVFVGVGVVRNTPEG